MKVLVTGAGTVGAAAARAARSRGDEVLLVDVRGDAAFEAVRCDVTDTARLMEVYGDWRPDAVLHTAGIIGRKVDAAPPLAIGVNVAGTTSVLECARRFLVPRVVLSSSLAVYDWSAPNPDRPVTEDQAGRPSSLYGASKLAAEILARQFAEGNGPAVTALRFAGVYGAPGGGGGALLSGTLTSVMRRLFAGEEVTLPPLLGCVEYLAAADAGWAMACAARADAPPWCALNVGAGRVHTGPEVAEVLRRVVPNSRVRGPEPPLRVPPLNLERAREALGYSPAFSLEDGLTALAKELRREEAACSTTLS